MFNEGVNYRNGKKRRIQIRKKHRVGEYCIRSGMHGNLCNVLLQDKHQGRSYRDGAEELSSQRQHHAFVSKIHQEGKFKLLGWDIDNTDEKGVYIVSYTIRWLNKDGFKIGDPVGYWFKVDPKKGFCEPICPEGTTTPKEQEG